jgi:hypothetical protein
LYNVSDRWQHVAFGAVAYAGVADPWERLSAFTPEPNSGFYAVPPYAAWWLTEPPDRDPA